MPYFNYHAKARNLIRTNHLIKYEIVKNWNGIEPALVLYFDNHRPMPIREYRFDEYLTLINESYKENYSTPPSKHSS